MKRWVKSLLSAKMSRDLKSAIGSVQTTLSFAGIVSIVVVVKPFSVKTSKHTA